MRPIAMTDSQTMKEEEKKRISKILAEHYNDMDTMREADTTFLENSSGKSIIAVQNAFAADKSKTATQKTEEEMNSSNFLKASKFIKENAGTALMLMGTTLVIVGVPVPGMAPTVLAVVATGLGVMGSMEKAWASMVRKGEMATVVQEQRTRLHKESLEKMREATKKEFLAMVDQRFEKHPLQQKIKFFERKIKELSDKILNLERKAVISDKIKAILSMGVLQVPVNNGADFISFQEFKQQHAEVLSKLDELMKKEGSLDLSFKVKYNPHEAFRSFYTFKAHLLSVQTEIQKDLQSKTIKSLKKDQQVESLKKINIKIEEIRKKWLVPETPSDLVIVHLATQVGAKLSETVQRSSKNKQLQKDIHELNALVEDARKLDPNIQQMTLPKKTLDFATKKDLEILDSSLKFLQGYIPLTKQGVSQTTEVETPEMTLLQNELVSVTENLQKLKKNNEKEIKKLQKAYEEVMPIVDEKIKAYIDETAWYTGLQASVQNLAAQATPLALSLVQGAEQFAKTMDSSLKVADTTPVDDTEVLKMGQSAGIAATNKVAAEAVLKGAEAVASVAEIAAESSNATVHFVLDAIYGKAAELKALSAVGDVVKGIEAVVAAAEKAANENGATAASVSAAANAVSAIAKAKVDETTTISEGANQAFKAIQQRLTVGDINKIKSIVSDVSAGVGEVSILLTTAVKSLEESLANDDIRFLDFLRIEQVCKNVPFFRSTGIIDKYFTPSNEFDKVIKKLRGGHELKKVMLEIMKMTLDSSSVRSRSEVSFENTLANIQNAISKINATLLTVEQDFDEQLSGLQVYFPPDDNLLKQRFNLMANEEQVNLLKNIMEIKKLIVSVYKTIQEQPPERLENIKKDRVLKQQLTTVDKAIALVEKKMENQLKKNQMLSEKYEKYRKPYINVFANVDNPGVQLNECIKNAQFSDLLLLLAKNELKEFSKFLEERRPYSELAKEFCEIYRYGVNDNLPEYEAKRIEFAKKVALIANDPDAKQADLSELQEVFKSYCHPTRVFSPQSLKKINGEAFTSAAELTDYVKNNEQLYHSQRVLGVQKLAVVESLQKTLKGELNEIYQKLGYTTTPAATIHLPTDPALASPVQAVANKRTPPPPPPALERRHSKPLVLSKSASTGRSTPPAPPPRGETPDPKKGGPQAKA